MFPGHHLTACWSFGDRVELLYPLPPYRYTHVVIRVGRCRERDMNPPGGFLRLSECSRTFLRVYSWNVPDMFRVPFRNVLELYSRFISGMFQNMFRVPFRNVLEHYSGFISGMFQNMFRVSFRNVLEHFSGFISGMFQNMFRVPFRNVLEHYSGFISGMFQNRSRVSLRNVFSLCLSVCTVHFMSLVSCSP